MAANKGGPPGTPWYKVKFHRSKYISMGDPEPLREDDLIVMDGWVPISEDKESMWADSKSVVDQKNKKREFFVAYDEKPTRTATGEFQLMIEILHTDRRGFTYTAEAPDLETLNRHFWPVVERLIAHYFSPRLRKPVQLPVPDEQGDKEKHYQDAVGRMLRD